MYFIFLIYFYVFPLIFFLICCKNGALGIIPGSVKVVKTFIIEVKIISKQNERLNKGDTQFQIVGVINIDNKARTINAVPCQANCPYH